MDEHGCEWMCFDMPEVNQWAWRCMERYGCVMDIYGYALMHIDVYGGAWVWRLRVVHGCPLMWMWLDVPIEKHVHKNYTHN